MNGFNIEDNQKGEETFLIKTGGSTGGGTDYVSAKSTFERLFDQLSEKEYAELIEKIQEILARRGAKLAMPKHNDISPKALFTIDKKITLIEFCEALYCVLYTPSPFATIAA